MALAQSLQSGRELVIQFQRDERTGMVLLDGTAAVGGQLQHGRRARQGALPVVALRLQNLPGQPAPLPDGIVGVLDGQRRQRIGLTLTVGAVQGAKLAGQHAHRPAVGDDVVHGDEQHMLALIQPDEPAADQRAGLQIERGVGFLDGQPPATLLRHRCVDAGHAPAGQSRWSRPQCAEPVDHRRG